MSINRATLLGHVGQDPEIRSTQDGKEVASFYLATSQNWTDKRTGERRSQTEWHRVIVFSERLAEIVKKYVRKGSKLYLEGEIKNRKWTDKQGIERFTTEIVLQNFGSSLQLLDKKEVEQNQQTEVVQHHNSSVADEFDDEIPFN